MILLSLTSKWQTYQVIIYTTLLLIKFALCCKIYNCNVNAKEGSVSRNFRIIPVDCYILPTYQ